MTDVPASDGLFPEDNRREPVRPRADDPVVLPGPTMRSMTDEICANALRKRAFLWWYILIAPFALGTAILIAAITWLFYAGIGIWGVSWPVMWGYALIGYVWWIAIASGGTFISALFYLCAVEWRTSLNRLAETMTLFAAACAGIYPILHLGRPWLFYWLFPYWNIMTIWPQFRSPLLWDFFAIFTYVTTSIFFWYFGLIPDFASMRDRAKSRGQQIFYGVLALGFRGSERQWRHYHPTYGIMAAIMAPLVVSVHSIVGLDFAGGATVGWHETQFPPFFVFGALLSGFAMVLLWAIPLRRLLGLESYITGHHLDILCKLLLVSSICIGYSYMMEAFMAFYSGEKADKINFMAKVSGSTLAWIYWATIAFNVTLPQLMWFRRCRLNQTLVLIVSLLVIFGMWCERYTIVVMSLRRTHLPSAWGNFIPTIWDWATLWGTVGLFATGILVAIRFVPVISMAEMRGLIQSREQEEERA